MTWTCTLCQNVNNQSTWCCNPRCGARWNSTKDKPIYDQRPTSTSALPASARSSVGASHWQQERQQDRPQRGRSGSRPRANTDKGGKSKGKAKDQDGKGKDQDKDKGKPEVEPWLKDFNFQKSPPWVSMSTWQETLDNPGLPPPPPDTATKETLDSYFEQIRETMRLAITTYKMEWVMKRPCDTTAKLIGACKRRLLNHKSLDDQLKEIEKFEVLGNDKMQELLQCKDYYEDMMAKINIHIEYKNKDLKVLELCRDEIKEHQRQLEDAKELERRSKLAKSPFEATDKTAGTDMDDEELLKATPFGISSQQPFSSSPAASPFTAAPTPSPAPPFADSVKSQADMFQLIQQQVDKRMESVANDFTNQLLMVQRTLMEAVMADKNGKVPVSPPPPPAPTQTLSPTQQPDEETLPRSPRQGQERFADDGSPLRPNIKQASKVHTATQAATERAEASRTAARQDKLAELRKQDTSADTVDLTAEEPTTPAAAGGA